MGRLPRRQFRSDASISNDAELLQYDVPKLLCTLQCAIFEIPFLFCSAICRKRYGLQGLMQIDGSAFRNILDVGGRETILNGSKIESVYQALHSPCDRTRLKS